MKWYQRVMNIILIPFIWILLYPIELMFHLWDGLPASEAHIEMWSVTKELWAEATE